MSPSNKSIIKKMGIKHSVMMLVKIQKDTCESVLLFLVDGEKDENGFVCYF